MIETSGTTIVYFPVYQVLHHLQPEDSSDFDNAGLCLREIYRVLKPKGAVIINFCTPEQSFTGFWFLQLFSELLQKKISKRLVVCSTIRPRLANIMPE